MNTDRVLTYLKILEELSEKTWNVSISTELGLAISYYSDDEGNWKSEYDGIQSLGDLITNLEITMANVLEGKK